jgi:hypothetical protein
MCSGTPGSYHLPDLRADQKTKTIDLIPYGGLLPDEKLMEGKQVRVTLDEDLRRIESVRLCEENDKDHQN